MKLKFVVITGVHDWRDVLYDGLKYEIELEGEKVEAVNIDDVGAPKELWRPVSSIKVPTFEIGEILICDEQGVSIPDQRKPWKWGVKYEIFDSIEKAVEKAVKVLQEDSKGVA